MSRSFDARLVLTALLALGSLGASCGGGGDTTGRATSGGGGESAGDRVERLPDVDTTSLTAGERRAWGDLVNDLLSPCGEPVSVATCASERRACPKCVPAARYLARLVTEGYEKVEIEQMYAARYARDQVVQIDVDRAPVRGAAMAAVTLVEFSDFECPHCGAAHPILKRLIQENPGRVRVVFMHYPLDGHVNAVPAARASVAAGNQGKFWEMHDLLFEHQDALAESDLLGYARDLGLDMTRFEADFRSEETQRRVEADKALGRSLEVGGTPTFFVNGRRFHEGPRTLPAYVREELEP